MHETLHAMGLDHNINSPDTIMSPYLNSQAHQLVFNRDIQGLRVLWRPPEKWFFGKAIEDFDKYESEMMRDAITTVSGTDDNAKFCGLK